jgi:hypothetical protein
MKPQISSLLPAPIQEMFDLMGPGGSGAVDFVVSRIQLALFIVVGALVLFAVIYALIASFKYIRSQGDPNEIEEAQKAIKAIFMGLGALMIGIIGIVLVFVFFGLSAPQTALSQVCISAAGSPGCTACQSDADSNLCQFCEAIYRAEADGTLRDANHDGLINDDDIRTVRQIDGLFANGNDCVE